ncbi:MAG TPA: tetratricopeptide repeat protein [Pyrinomonadaceae bacterium]|nr:tetratricopeptide repeat protein [Pyrinomonadaceae bacterium]
MRDTQKPSEDRPPTRAVARRAGVARHARRVSRSLLCASLLLASLAPAFVPAFARAAAQGGDHTLWGDLKVDESKAEGLKPISFDIALYTDNGNLIGRQTVSNHGRYRFLNLPNGSYDLTVEVDGEEVVRMRVRIVGSGAMKSDYQQDIELEWRARPAAAAKSGNASAADFYKRAGANQKLYDRAEEAMAAKSYGNAAALLQQLVAADPKDFPAWAELGTAYLYQENAAEAEKAYLRAAEVKPDFVLAYLDLARLRMAQKNFDGAVEILTRAVALQPPSADANFLLGECYLQVKKGSKAVPYLEEAARLGRADARLRLAALYDRAGLKDRAAAEYEQFLAARPDYPERKKLEQYIKENKKQ